MTLKPYDAQALDQFALRFLDLASMIRSMANRCREHEINDFPLHDKKALEWCLATERWARKSRAELEMRILEARATQRAEAVSEGVSE
jgi:hypothetical protein